MKDAERQPSFDPYRGLEPNLKFGDWINRWMLFRPRQKIVQLLKGQSVLDVCCGTGNLAAMLAAAGCQVVGVDRSPAMLSFARLKPIAARFKQADATRLGFDREFDAAVVSLAIHEMPAQDREKVWESMRRAVVPGGRLIALDFAVPQRQTPLARFFGGLIEQDERSTLNNEPEHYHNYQDFMRSGGLLAWIQTQGQPVASETRFWGGTLAVAVMLNPNRPGGQ